MSAARIRGLIKGRLREYVGKRAGAMARTVADMPEGEADPSQLDGALDGCLP
jgi:hypothetical protein